MQNCVGGTNPDNARFVPPPAEDPGEMLGDLERYFHAESDLPPLVRCELIHYQFERLHPFNDGNGRLGRLLIALYLLSMHTLDEPMLYSCAYLKTHQQEYYDRLQQVRTEGAYEKCITFFLEGVVGVCKMVIDTTKRIQALKRNDIDALVEAGAGSEGIAFVRFLLTQPVVRVKDIEKNLDVSYTKANKLRSLAEELGIVSQLSAGTRNREYSYHTYISIRREGPEVVLPRER